MIEYLQYVGELLTPEVINVLLIMCVAVLIFFVAYVSSAIAGTEQGKQALTIWKMVDDALYNAAMVMLHTDYDVDEAQDMANNYEKLYGKKIDPRLAYSIKQAENHIEKHAPFDFDFWDVYHRAEAIYQDRIR